MTIKHKIYLLVSLAALLVVLLVISNALNLHPLRFNIPSQTSSQSGDQVETNTETSEYSNNLFGVSFMVPAGWEIDSSYIDAATSTKAAFDEGVSYVQMFGVEPGTGRQEKMELYIQPAQIPPAEFVKQNENNQIVVSNGVQWFVRRIQAENSEAVLAEALVPINYPGVEERYGLITIAGFVFNNEELSEYSDAMKTKVLDLISTFKKS